MLADSQTICMALVQGFAKDVVRKDGHLKQVGPQNHHFRSPDDILQ